MPNPIVRDQELSLVPVPPSAPVAISQAEHDNLRDLWQRRKAHNTYRGYSSDWKIFQVWAFSVGATTLPASPDTVARYLGHMQASGRATNTIAHHAAAISHYCREAGKEDPTQSPLVQGIMMGVRRANAGRPLRAKAALLTKHLRKALKEPKTPLEHRNRALALIGFAAGLRRSELVGIDVEHLTWSDEGAVRIALLKSKTNQTGELESVWVLSAGNHCPVRALREWLRVANIESGAVFRSVDRHANVGKRLSTDAVGYIVKGLAKKAGLDVRQYSAHSLRAGLVTQGFMNEVPIELIQQQTRHRSVDTLLRYRREVEPQRRNVSASLGL